MNEHTQPLAAVTGITGFIGGHLASLLAASGWRVRALARSMPKLTYQGGPPIEVVTGSLSDKDALARLVEGADAVIHLAGAIKGRSREALLRANAAGTSAIAEAWRDHCCDQARDHGSMSRFILLSSLAARAPEISDYAASKAAGEDALIEIGADLPWVILRPGAVYGPGDRETLAIFRAANGPIQAMLNGAMRGSRPSTCATSPGRSWPWRQRGTPGATYELSDENITGYSWPDLSETAVLALGRAPRPFRLPPLAVRGLGLLGDVTGTLGVGSLPSNQKVREILHPDWGARAHMLPPPEIWRPEISLDDGFAETIAWYRDAGWLKQ